MSKVDIAIADGMLDPLLSYIGNPVMQFRVTSMTTAQIPLRYNIDGVKLGYAKQKFWYFAAQPCGHAIAKMISADDTPSQ